MCVETSINIILIIVTCVLMYVVNRLKKEIHILNLLLSESIPPDLDESNEIEE